MGELLSGMLPNTLQYVAIFPFYSAWLLFKSKLSLAIYHLQTEKFVVWLLCIELPLLIDKLSTLMQKICAVHCRVLQRWGCANYHIHRKLVDAHCLMHIFRLYTERKNSTKNLFKVKYFVHSKGRSAWGIFCLIPAVQLLRSFFISKETASAKRR